MSCVVFAITCCISARHTQLHMSSHAHYLTGTINALQILSLPIEPKTLVARFWLRYWLCRTHPTNIYQIDAFRDMPVEVLGLIFSLARSPNPSHHNGGHVFNPQKGIGISVFKSCLYTAWRLLRQVTLTAQPGNKTHPAQVSNGLQMKFKIL